MFSAGERPAAAHLLRTWVRIPPRAWIFVCCECRVLSGRGLCDELITRLEESYRLCCVVVWSRNIKNWCSIYIYIYIYMTLVAWGLINCTLFFFLEIAAFCNRFYATLFLVTVFSTYVVQIPVRTLRCFTLKYSPTGSAVMSQWAKWRIYLTPSDGKWIAIWAL